MIGQLARTFIRHVTTDFTLDLLFARLIEQPNEPITRRGLNDRTIWSLMLFVEE